ncbi:hypothetical protein [Pontibacter indicus]|nr:hypothetical protein [Pontibacter indicus]
MLDLPTLHTSGQSPLNSSHSRDASEGIEAAIPIPWPEAPLYQTRP